MKLKFNKVFIKKYARLRTKIKLQCYERLQIFKNTPFHPILNNHKLIGEHKWCRSINVTGDIRIIFIQATDDLVRIVDIDTHSNLYG